jgi:hypothetical protein
MPHLLVHFIFKSERASKRKYNFRVCPHSCLFSLLFLPSRGKGRKQKNGHFKIYHLDTRKAKCDLKRGYWASTDCTCVFWLVWTWQNSFICLIFESLNALALGRIFLTFSVSPLWRTNRQRTRWLEWHYLQYKYYIYLGFYNIPSFTYMVTW